MKKRLKTILALLILGVACFIAGCSSETKLEKYQKQGYTIMVTYDGNGGSFLNRQGVTLIDLFRPTDYQMDENQEVHIKLMEPTVGRPSTGQSEVTLTKQQHFFAGWYKNRELRTDVDGTVLNAKGERLQEVDGKYFLEGTETESEPGYIYSDYWDFANDTIDYKQSDGLFAMTLYAGWVPYYEFAYYYRVEGTTEWNYVESSYFDYKVTNEENSKTHDKDTIWIPGYKGGAAMDHNHAYANTSLYQFPKVSGTTFKAAYTDKDCTQQITDSFEHQGTLDLQSGIGVDLVQNIYIEVEQGERFKIRTAQEFVTNAKTDGIYEIQADLDFTDLEWPTALMFGKFTGKIYSVGQDGETYKFSNILAEGSSTAAANGGLFGEIAETATVKNVQFINAMVDFAKVAMPKGETQANFGFFAGYVHEDADVSGVTVGGKLRFGDFDVSSASEVNDCHVNVVGNGELTGVTHTTVTVETYGRKYASKYQYSFVPIVLVDADDLSITFDYSKKNAENRIENEVTIIGTY